MTKRLPAQPRTVELSTLLGSSEGVFCFSTRPFRLQLRQAAKVCCRLTARRALAQYRCSTVTPAQLMLCTGCMCRAPIWQLDVPSLSKSIYEPRLNQLGEGDGVPHPVAEQQAPLRRMSDRANGGHQENFQDDGRDIELSGLTDSPARSDTKPNGEHGGIKHGPAPAGGALHRAVDWFRQLLGGSSNASAWAGGFSPVGSEEADPSYPGATQGTLLASLLRSASVQFVHIHPSLRAAHHFLAHTLWPAGRSS